MKSHYKRSDHCHITNSSSCGTNEEGYRERIDYVTFVVFSSQKESNRGRCVQSKHTHDVEKSVQSVRDNT